MPLPTVRRSFARLPHRGPSAILALLVAWASIARAQSPTDRLRGKVTNDSAQVVVGATVIVTRGPDRAIKQTTTDSTGAWAIAFENGTGDYLVGVTAPGYANARRRVQASNSDQHTFAADFILRSNPNSLAAVKVVADKPVRASGASSPYQPEVGASEKWNDGVAGQLAPGTQGDLNALAGNSPGIVAGPGGPSMMGADPGSNLTTLNGLALPGGSLPRAARADTRVTGATFDPTRGGFAGANIDVRLGAGGRDFMSRTAYLTLEPQPLQFTDAVGRSIGARTGAFKGSVGMDGELLRQLMTYNVSVEFSQGENEPATLLTADAATLLRAGVAFDSVTRARSAAAGAGIPLSGIGVPLTRERSGVTWLGRFDLTSDSLDARTLTTYYANNESGALGLGPTGAPSATGRRTDGGWGVQLALVDFFGDGRRTMNRVRMGYSRQSNESAPYLSLPGAGVLVASSGVDGDGLATLGLGGATQFAGRTDRWTAEGSEELLWTAGGRRHLFKTIVWGRMDGLTQTGRGNPFGRYQYNSINDLSAGQPASFSRTLSAPDRTGTTWNAATAIAHQWAPSRTFSMLYGARVEANGFASIAASNPALESALGVGTGTSLTRLHLSPRVGFSWTYSRDKDNGNGMNSTQVGQFYRTTTGVIRGGIGEFRDLLRPDALADASARTGLPGSTQLLNCVGSTVPTPDWSTWATNPGAIPTSCVGGGGILTDIAPPATLFDRDFDVARSWRATLDWSQNIGPWLIKVGAIGSMDLNQPSTVDANFAAVNGFALGSEGNRPVFVPVGAVDVNSGALSAAASRRSGSFGGVGVRTSDLRGYGSQLNVTLSPDVFKLRDIPGSPYGSLTYTLQESRRQYRGFDGAAFGDPRLVEWGPSASDARHTFLLQGGFHTGVTGTFTLFMRAQSGLPFTPLVQGDVNGDGRGGDRAFVPNPATTPDTALSRQLRALLATGSESARDCLVPLLGRVAGRGACRAPWTTTFNAQWSVPLPNKIGNRFTASVYLENVLGAVDQALHGSAGLRGWGGPMNMDPMLLVPTGFDSAARTFRYRVNPRFAESRPAFTLDRAPFRLTLDFQLRFHTDYDLQQLQRALEPVKVKGQWERRTVDSLTALYLRRTSSLAKAMLAESDSLFLSAAQVGALRVIDSTYSAQVRGLYRPLAEYLQQFPDGGANKTALDSVATVSKAYWKLFWEQPEIVEGVVNSTQRELMPMLQNILQVPKKQREQSRWFFGNAVTLTDGKAAPAASVGIPVPPPG